MTITFIFPDWVDPEATIEPDKRGLGIGHFNFAIATLSAVLKKEGYTVRLLHICFRPEEPSFKQQLQGYRDTDLFAFSFTEVEAGWVKDMNRWIREQLGTSTIGGGIYPTINPVESLTELGLDLICIGEGERALPEVCQRLGSRDFSGIRNVWFVRDGEIVRNQTGEFVEDLDTLPRYDHELFDPSRLKNFNSRLPRLFYLCTRNCPFSCSFCSNHVKRTAICAGKHYVRHFSTDRIISDIKYFIGQYPFIKLVHFADEVIHYDKKWFREFISRYRQEIGLPWRSYAMLSILDEEMIKLMAWSGCTRVNCGIEAGTARIRNIYGRPRISNEAIIERIALLKQYGIDVHTSTLLNAPGERLDEMLQTIKLVARADTSIAVTGILVPYQGTALYQLAARDHRLYEHGAYENTDVGIVPVDTTTEKVLFLYHGYRLLVELYKLRYRLPGIAGTLCEWSLDAVVTSRLLPHSLLIGLRKRFFQGKILNWSYSRVEKKLGRQDGAFQLPAAGKDDMP